MLAFALPFLRRLRGGGCWGLLVCGLALGLALLAFDAWEGGLGWRYMIDFAWLLALAALPALLAIAGAWTPALRRCVCAACSSCSSCWPPSPSPSSGSSYPGATTPSSE